MKIILGAGGTAQDGFVSTEKESLDLLNPGHFERLSEPVDAFFAEHVWEHLQRHDGYFAAQLCRHALRPGGRLRIAVPDRYHPDAEYQAWVRPGGKGPGSADHKVEYDFGSLAAMLINAGYQAVHLLEWWDAYEIFHRVDYDEFFGRVRRSSRHDHRNVARPLAYTSLIVDAVKEGE